MNKETVAYIPMSPEHEKPHAEYEYQVLENPELRRDYVNLTERLIADALEQDADTVIFLDKSARPVSWLMRSLWPTLGFKDFDDNGEAIIEKMPEMKFLNIDREGWEPMMGRSEGKEGVGITLEYVPDDTIDSLTGLYTDRMVGRDEYISADESTFLDDKNVLIVDEVRVSGDTLAVAEALVGKAFKNAKSIKGQHWMNPGTVLDKRSGGYINADLPVWYSDDSPRGRLVADINNRKSRASTSPRQRRGSQFLSTRFDEPDKKGIQLRKEMKALGEEVAQGLYPVAPASIRGGGKPFKEKFVHYTSGLSIEEFAKLRQRATEEKSSFTQLMREYKAARDTE